MKVLEVTHRYPPHVGGVERHVEQVSRRLAAHGHDVTVVTADARDGRTRERRGDVTVIRHPSVAPGDAYYLAPAIARTVRNADADVVHAHNYHAFPLLFAALGVTDERFVVTPHYHGESTSRLRDALLSVYHPLGARAVRKADHVIAVSEWEADQLRTAFGVDPVVIPHGLDYDRFQPREREPGEDAGKEALCVGRLEPYKGVDHAIRALTVLPEFTLRVVGTGPDRERLERIAVQAGVRDRVAFDGHVTDDELLTRYRNADVVCALSAFEAYGMTVAEALGAGTPAVVYANRGLRQWRDVEGVRSVAERSPVAVATAMRAASALRPAERPIPDWEETTTAIERQLTQA
ncbi:glycosyltransferase family 4 protein [Halobacteriaceae archaeon GCM10025711]